MLIDKLLLALVLLVAIVVALPIPCIPNSNPDNEFIVRKYEKKNEKR